MTSSGIISTRLDDQPAVWKIVFEDLIMLVATWVNLLLWRGGWDLCVKYFIPDPLICGWICHWLGSVGLIALQVGVKCHFISFTSFISSTYVPVIV